MGKDIHMGIYVDKGVNGLVFRLFFTCLLQMEFSRESTRMFNTTRLGPDP